jgi:hypothetical protein
VRAQGEGGVAGFFLLLAHVFIRPLVLHPLTTTFVGYDTQTHTGTLHWLSFVLDTCSFRYPVLSRGRWSPPGFRSLSRVLERSPAFVRAIETRDGDRIYEVREWQPR